jgi:transcriptional regulator with XRE-family HTH domain
MRNTNIDWVQMSDVAIVKQIGSYIKQMRLQQNKTQAQLADMAGLNRWTISQIENGESITLTSFIQILRALDSLFVLNVFEVPDEISPLEYAKLKKHKKERVRNKPTNKPDKDNLRW